MNKEDLKELMNPHDYSPDINVPCPVCDEKLREFLGTSTHNIGPHPDFSIKSKIECTRCFTKWEKKELFMYYSLKLMIENKEK